ncbi:MAG: CDP-diacylglycerol--glycerol-3-phosphate 3-phosphatidyltransferase [Bdellovibrionota bacterium]
MTTAASLPLPEWKKRLPMALTWSRMGVCPILVAFLYLDQPMWSWMAAGLFIMASITDWLDGHLARKFNVISNMGKFMDPIADKILVATVLIMLIPSKKVGPIVVLLLLARDILIGGIRSVAAADRVIIDAKAAGKWKTGMQMVAIPALLIDLEFMGVEFREIGFWLLWISVLLSLFSGYQYVKVYFENKKAGS